MINNQLNYDWYERSYEKDPEAEYCTPGLRKTDADWTLIQEAFVDMIMIIRDKDGDKVRLQELTVWLACELNVDKTLFNMGLL